MEEKNILCAASAYEQKFYFNKIYDRIPTKVKEELQIMCVLYTEDVGGILEVKFADDGRVLLETRAKDSDINYDDIGAELLIGRLQEEKEELFKQLEIFYRIFVLGETFEEAGGDDTDDDR